MTDQEIYLIFHKLNPKMTPSPEADELEFYAKLIPLAIGPPSKPRIGRAEVPIPELLDHTGIRSREWLFALLKSLFNTRVYVNFEIGHSISTTLLTSFGHVRDIITFQISRTMMGLIALHWEDARSEIILEQLRTSHQIWQDVCTYYGVTKSKV